jgi:3D (Asp-Asp-Asp) domain-containing protein
MRTATLFLALAVTALLPTAQAALAEQGQQSRWVTATAYTSRPSEIANKKSKKTACDDQLTPESKGQTIAVSSDLAQAGLKCGTVVTIEGVSSGFVVTDRVPGKRNHIDIYVGKDVQMAKEWSRRKVKITWTPQTGPDK